MIDDDEFDTPAVAITRLRVTVRMMQEYLTTIPRSEGRLMRLLEMANEALAETARYKNDF